MLTSLIISDSSRTRFSCRRQCTHAERRRYTDSIERLFLQFHVGAFTMPRDDAPPPRRSRRRAPACRFDADCAAHIEYFATRAIGIAEVFDARRWPNFAGFSTAFTYD